MAPAGKKEEKKAAKKASKDAGRAAEPRGGPSGLAPQHKVAACVAVVAAASAARLLSSGPSGKERVDVDLVDAGAISLTLPLGNTSISDADFEALSKSASFYAGHNGRRLRRWRDLVQAAAEAEGARLSLLQGPPQDAPLNRHFVWPGVQVGHKVTVADVPTWGSEPIELETLSMSPRVLYVKNFMSPQEADALVAKATDKSNPYSIRPSTVGHESWTQGSGAKAKTSQRTSENAFDVNSPTAVRLKDRAWRLLRLSGPYDEPMADGFQVLRYQMKQAYVPHMDSFPIGSSQDHNWDPAAGGTNRFATLFVYLSDVEEGGQTVFPKADRLGGPAEVPEHARQLFPKKSWESDMVELCYTRLSVQPKKGNAILFYSQQGGRVDPMAQHGGCPVLNGTKWAANLWFWNQCRFSLCQQRHKKAGVRMDEHLFKK